MPFPNVFGSPSVCCNSNRWEILSNRVPWAEILPTQIPRFVIDKRKRPSPMPLTHIPAKDNNNININNNNQQQQPTILPLLNELIEQCWDQNPNIRPSMDIVAQRLNDMIASEEAEEKKRKQQQPPSMERILMQMACTLQNVDLNVQLIKADKS